ncbi:MAG: hypothetical protein L0287_36470, partial [Anaerolineae bacterium]|nr:hypothetical protein [Anaerolineae bacterium]
MADLAGAIAKTLLDCQWQDTVALMKANAGYKRRSRFWNDDVGFRPFLQESVKGFATANEIDTMTTFSWMGSVGESLEETQKKQMFKEVFA